MAIHQDYYDIEVEVNDNVFDISPLAFSFTMSSSIHKIYPTLRIDLNDETGLLQEYYGTDLGNNISIQYGVKDGEVNKNTYIITGSSISDMSSTKNITGSVGIDLKHEWFSYQNRESKSYFNRISSLINDKLISSYRFSTVDINDTQNKDNWYQGNKTQGEFIKDILLPRAYSSNSGKSPFYCYIDNNNGFHLRNLSSFYNSKPKATYIYDPSRVNSLELGKDKIYTIYEINRWQTPIDNTTKDLFHRDIFYIYKDGTYEYKETEDLVDHLGNNRATSIPILNNKDNTNSIMEFLFESDVSDNHKGRINSSFKDFMFIDRFYCRTFLNPEIQPGDKIEVEIKIDTTDSKDELSQRFSGDYIVEMVSHIWDKNRNLGETQLLIGRGKIKKAPDYLFNKRLMPEVIQ